jgi:tRNA1(Val) A37 N6-methylase TrmN6
VTAELSVTTLAPPSPPAALDFVLRPDEQCIALTSTFGLIQPLRGHRYSVDDMLVAGLACEHAPAPRRVLDLGCGLGSILLLVAWARPDARLVGLEAQAEHVRDARRNVALNGCEARVGVVAGDLRDGALLARLGAFDLVTGSPPYFDPRRATVAADPTRAAAHWELRGGIEDYARAAAAALAPGGLFVACAAASPTGRAAAAFAAAGLGLVWRRPVAPRADKPPFLELLVGTPGAGGQTAVAAPLVLREIDGRRTAEHVAAREWTGLPAAG